MTIAEQSPRPRAIDRFLLAIDAWQGGKVHEPWPEVLRRLRAEARPARIGAELRDRLASKYRAGWRAAERRSRRA